MKALIEDYLSQKTSLWSEVTLARVTNVLKLCEGVLSDPRQLYDYLKSRGLSQYSIKTYMIVCGQFEKQMLYSRFINDFLKENSFAFRNCYKNKLTRIEPSHFAACLKQAPSEDIYNFLILIGRCGLRKSEAFNAKWSDIENGYLKVLGKGNKIRHVPILQMWLKPRVNGTVDQKISGACKGCTYFFRHKLKLSFHDFRAYYATQVSNHPELNIKDAQLLLGHSSMMTTQRYVRADLEKAKRVLCG